MSKYNIVDLVDYLLDQNQDESLSFKHATKSLPKFSRKPQLKDPEFLQDEHLKLRHEYTEYKAFVSQKQKEWKSFREKNQVHILVRTITNKNTNNYLEDKMTAKETSTKDLFDNWEDLSIITGACDKKTRHLCRKTGNRKSKRASLIEEDSNAGPDTTNKSIQFVVRSKTCKLALK